MSILSLARLNLRYLFLDGQTLGLLGVFAGLIFPFWLFGIGNPHGAAGSHIGALTGVCMGLFVFLSRWRRESLRSFLRCSPVPSASIRRGELMADLGLALLGAALTTPANSAWVGGVAARTSLLILWGGLVAVLVEDARWRLLPAICTLCFAVFFVPSVAFHCIDGAGADTIAYGATWVLAAACAAALAWVLRDRPFAETRRAARRGRRHAGVHVPHPAGPDPRATSLPPDWELVTRVLGCSDRRLCVRDLCGAYEVELRVLGCDRGDERRLCCDDESQHTGDGVPPDPSCLAPPFVRRIDMDRDDLRSADSLVRDDRGVAAWGFCVDLLVVR
ncbi:MAG: hypothetical protein HY608_09230 [Planctomycetes bacterium]|nr:hypothetical protein [Planctomycetota bacterium]